MKILTLGKLSRNKEEVKAMIEDLGGKVTGTANKATLCISTQSEQQCYIISNCRTWELVDYRGHS